MTAVLAALNAVPASAYFVLFAAGYIILVLAIEPDDGPDWSDDE